MIQSCWLCGASNNSQLGQVTQPIGYDAGFNLGFVVSISTSRPFGYQVLRKASRIGTHFRPHFPRHGSHIPGRTLYEWMPWIGILQVVIAFLCLPESFSFHEFMLIYLYRDHLLPTNIEILTTSSFRTLIIPLYIHKSEWNMENDGSVLYGPKL